MGNSFSNVLKATFWVGFDGTLSVLQRTVGSVWRENARSYSPIIEEHLRLLRMATCFYRFDSFGTHCAIGRRVRFWGPLRISIGERSAIFDDAILCGVGEIKLGDRTSIGHNTVVVARERVQIGDDVMVAAFCYITDVDHEFLDDGRPINVQDLHIKPVKIGNDVWIGAHTTVLRGVTIGDGCVIGANSVITKDLPAYSVAVGSPARVVRMRRTPSAGSSVEQRRKAP